jgi:hypothetical protein
VLTPRDIPVLECIARYFVMNRRQVQQLCYPNDNGGRITRRRLQALTRGDYLNKQRMLVVNPDDESPAPVYLIGNAGKRFLAEHFQDDRYLLKPNRIQHSQHIFHHVAVTQTHIAFDEAIARQEAVSIEQWHNEYDIVDADEPDHTQHFRLFTELQGDPKKLVCAPDSGFLLEFRGHRGVFYLEQDRGHNRYDHKRVANRKTPGYAQLLRRELHRKHFPASTLAGFTVLMVAQDAKRRDALRRAFRGKQQSTLWRFVSQADMQPETLLHENILYRCDDDDPQPIVKL